MTLFICLLSAGLYCEDIHDTVELRSLPFGETLSMHGAGLTAKGESLLEEQLSGLSIYEGT